MDESYFVKWMKENRIVKPEDLLNWMMYNLEYGFVGVDKKIYRQADITSTSFFKKYRLQSPKQVCQSKVGVCWDQAELERVCFSIMKYKFVVYYLEQKNPISGTHTFLTFWKDDKLFWFENSYSRYRGIHGPYESPFDIFVDLHTKMQQEPEGSDNGAQVHILQPPTPGLTTLQFMNFATKSKPIWTAK